MDRVFSVRMDEFVIRQVGDLSHQLRTTRKQVIERAVGLLAGQVGADKGEDALTRSFGAWERDEVPAETVGRVRKTFRQSMLRRHA